jgi:hypothetical protein
MVTITFIYLPFYTICEMSRNMYGIYGKHTQEACPLYNEQNRKWTLASLPNQEKWAQKYGVRILQQYHSGLEHTLLWVAEAENAQTVEELMARTAGRFNTISIVPLITFQELVERLKKVEDGTFFEN